jgi:hypothetical protein
VKRLFKIGIGLLIVALPMGLVVSTQGSGAGDGSARRPPKAQTQAAPLAEIAVPGLGTLQAQARRLQQAQVCPLDFMFATPSGDVRGRRSRQPSTSATEFFFPWLEVLGSGGSRAHSPQPDVGRVSFAAANPTADEAKGKIQGVYLDKSELIFKDANGMTLKFFLTKDCKVFINNKAGKITDLRPGDEAAIAYESRGLVPMVAVEIRCARR